MRCIFIGPFDGYWHGHCAFTITFASRVCCFTLVHLSQFALSHSMALFLTYDPFANGGGAARTMCAEAAYSVSVGALPDELREHLRVVSVIVPDVLHILRAKCTVLGFKAPNVLGSRLKLLADSLRAHL